MTSDRRRLLGRGPGATARETGATAAHRPRIVASQADLDNGPLHRLNLPDLDELRDRGVLDAHPLTD
ncbi:hypothetical protein ACF068_12495 [Streptomyces sp. NPDC016309]|uniref:hypothetical protein n=1 Tax=Streptomyces sp. NPDC016309 TaxID=3364965 RepID=UPI0036FA63B5